MFLARTERVTKSILPRYCRSVTYSCVIKCRLLDSKPADRDHSPKMGCNVEKNDWFDKTISGMTKMSPITRDQLTESYN